MPISHRDLCHCFVRFNHIHRALLSTTLLLCVVSSTGAAFAQNSLSEQPVSPQRDALHIGASAGNVSIPSELRFEEHLGAADLIAFGQILTPQKPEESRDFMRIHSFRLIKMIKGEIRPTTVTVFEPTGAQDIPLLASGEHYVLTLRRRSALAEYEILGDSAVNLHIDHRFKTPAGEPLRALGDRIRSALSLPPLDEHEDEIAEAFLPTGMPLLPTAPENDPDKALRPYNGESRTSTAPIAATQVILDEDFEGAFPGAWSVFDNNGATGGTVYWDDTSFRSYAGSWSSGCADGGANASSPGTDYANDMASWMMYGPFDLSDATAGTFSFRFWNDSELDFDYFKYLVSINGANFSGYQYSGTSGGWLSRTVDLTNVPTLGDVTGDSSVWIAFVFTSDFSVTSEGAYVDEVRIEKTTATAADLALQLIDAPSGTFAPGDSITISNTTENIGGVTSDAYRITFYASTNTIISTADHEIGFVDRSAIASGGVHNFNTTGPLPGDLADGSYYIGAILTVADASSANNTNHDAVPMTVTGGGGGGTPEIRITPTTLTFGEASRNTPTPTQVTGTKNGAPNPELLQQLAAKARERGRVRVIVGLDAGFVPEGYLARPLSRGGQRHRIAQRQNELFGQLRGGHADLVAQYRFIPFLALEVDEPTLAELGRLAQVTSIEEDVVHPPLMASSNPVIGSGNAWAQGYTGTGQAVAVLDTGVDKSHPFFTTGDTKVISEACYSTTNSTNGSTSVCPGGVESSTAPGSGVNCSLSVSGCDHGTHVAGTVAGHDGAGPNFGVARDSDIIAIQVFSQFSSCDLFTPTCVGAYTSDIIQGLERVLALANTIDIAAVNMSLGGGQYFSSATCDTDNASTKAAIDNLRSVGIATVVASGNDDYTNSMSSPGCISTAVSVGATTDSDAVASFSNVASFLDLLAPGVSINSSVPGGGIGNKNGTSMATPHVAGAWAVLKQAAPSASVDDILTALHTTGTSVNDGRSGGTVTDLRRINVDLAVSTLAGGSNQSFIIHNDGTANLSVTSIALQSSASWIQWSPGAPFTVPPGGSRAVFVTVDLGSAPQGSSTRQLVVQSNDADESPYPGAVNIVVDTTTGPSMIFADGFESGNVSEWSSAVGNN